MWKHTEINAYTFISLHDCKAGSFQMEGDDLIISFPDGFTIMPVGKPEQQPKKTGPSELRFIGFGLDAPIDSVSLFKTTRLFGCRKIQMDTEKFLSLMNDGHHKLEFIKEWHDPISSFYECQLWKNHKKLAECQLKVFAKSITYSWNEP